MLSSPTPSPSIHSHWNPVVIVVVGSVCAIFLVISYYRILYRCGCGFQLSSVSRNQASLHRINEENADDPSLQFQSGGVDSFIARSLPIVQFRKKNDAEKGGYNTGCAVCLGEFQDGEWIKHLPNCSHVFHVSCIDIWFQVHSSCPLCRAHIFDLEASHSLEEILSRDD